MPLTPIDVQQKTFATALRGYDLDEVDDFLDSVVVALKDYDQRLSDAQERISTLEAELNDKGDAEGAIARALVAAQRSADAIVADAKEEAQRILSDADSEANELAETKESERRRLQSEIDDLRSKASSVRSRVAELAAAIPVTLDQIDEVLDSGIEQPAGATFDAAVPVGGYEIESDDEPEVADSDVADAIADAEFLDDEPVDAEFESESELEEEGLIVLPDEPAFDGDGSDFGITDDDAPDFGAAADESLSDVEDEFGGSARHLAADEPSRELPTIEELSERIDSAFDDLVAEADDVAESAQRPWEDS